MKEIFKDIFEDYLDTMEAVSDAPSDTSFSIRDDLTAEWALKTIAAERAESERLNSVRRAMIDEYTQAIDNENARCARRCAHLERLLADYFNSVPHKTTKTQQSYALPSGKLVLKQPPVQYKRDDAALGKWLTANDYTDLVEVKTVPKWADLKKRGIQTMPDGQCVYTETGEIIAGVTATTPEPVFQVIVRDEP